jgi:glycosyltransferase involved in cell wall biosynthesis
MKILIVSQYFWPENFRINDLALELQNRGHQVTVLTGWPNYPAGNIFPDFRAKPKNYSNYNGIKVIRVPLIPRGKGVASLIANYLCFMVSASIFGPLKLAGLKFDKIFVNQLSPVTVALPAIVLKYIKKAPVVLWVLDLWPESLTAVGAVKSKKIIKWVGILVSFIYNHCDQLLAQSRSFMDNIRGYCKEPRDIGYFPSWAEDSFLQNSNFLASEVPASANKMFSIMFAGNIGDAQDFQSILSAADILKSRADIRWLIVGDGRASDWVRHECQLRGLGEQFIMLGSYPLDRMPSFYATADALLVSLKAGATFSKTIPGKLQSYLVSGKPIIGMINGEGALVIRDSGAGYVCDAGNVEDLVKIVSSMASLSSKERAKMGASGKNYYQSEFNKSVLVDRLESWLEDVNYRSRR